MKEETKNWLQENNLPLPRILDKLSRLSRVNVMKAAEEIYDNERHTIQRNEIFWAIRARATAMPDEEKEREILTVAQAQETINRLNAEIWLLKRSCLEKFFGYNWVYYL